MHISLASDDQSSMTRMTALKLGSMTASGRNHIFQRWLAAVMVLLISVWSAAPVQAWPWGGDQNSSKAREDRIVDDEPADVGDGDQHHHPQQRPEDGEHKVSSMVPRARRQEPKTRSGVVVDELHGRLSSKSPGHACRRQRVG